MCRIFKEILYSFRGESIIFSLKSDTFLKDFMLYKSCHLCFWGVHAGHTPGQGSFAPLQVKLSRSGEHLQDHWSSGYYTWASL